MSATTLIGTPGDANIHPLTPKIAVSMVIVTPEIASRWLAANTANRKLRDGKVIRYAADMAAGRWTADASAICFSPDGKLLNGQHRLHAVIRSGKSIPFVVMRNVPAEAMANMDTGAKRSGGDFFAFNGMKHVHLTSSAAKFAALVADGRVYKDRRLQEVSTSEQHAFLLDNPDLHAWIDIASRVRKNISAPPTVIAVAGWLFARATDPEQAMAFLNRLATRADLRQGHPILALDSRLRNIRDRRARPAHREYLALFVKAWNYDRRGQSVSQINLPDSGARIPEVLR